MLLIEMTENIIFRRMFSKDMNAIHPVWIYLSRENRLTDLETDMSAIVIIEQGRCGFSEGPFRCQIGGGGKI